MWQNGVAVEYIHPGRNITYECTASGGQFTVWRGSALGSQCVVTLYHRHFGTKDAFDSCKNGTVVGQGIRRDKDNYTSLLTVFVSPDLNGKTIECHLINGGHGEIQISSMMLHLFFSGMCCLRILNCSGIAKGGPSRARPYQSSQCGALLKAAWQLSASVYHLNTCTYR